jgi:hypothetical protein
MNISIFATTVSTRNMSSISLSYINNCDVFMIRYIRHSGSDQPVPIHLHSKENSFRDLKEAIIYCYYWNCKGKNCSTNRNCSCSPEVHNIRLVWWNYYNGIKIKYISAPSNAATPPHSNFSIQRVVYVSDDSKLGFNLSAYTTVFFDTVSN